MPSQSFYQRDGDYLQISRQQASDFAKQLADDFNPLHDIDAKRFCVPGDLLFAISLATYGLSAQMQFRFDGMVDESTRVKLPAAGSSMQLRDDQGKNYLQIERSGAHSDDQTLISNLTLAYVQFSGKTFPHILVPLMQAQQVMINPERPMVIYESMAINLQRLDIQQPLLTLDRQRTRLEVEGKRGKVCLAFTLSESGQTVGQGEKHMLLSGLRAFDAAAMDGLVAGYIQDKQNYRADGRS